MLDAITPKLKSWYAAAEVGSGVTVATLFVKAEVRGVTPQVPEWRRKIEIIENFHTIGKSFGSNFKIDF